MLGRPVHRIVQALAADGLEVAAGTLCGALKQVAPLIAPWAEAIAAHGRTAGHVHADETSWQVFEDVEDKDGHRWWLWVFVTSETSVFVMDTSRSAGVAAGQLGIDREQTALEAGRRLVISSDFHKAYQSLACIDGVDPLWCWAQYAESGIMRNGAAGVAWVPCRGGASPDGRGREVPHNHRLSRKARTGSGGRYRPGVVWGGVVRASARSLSSRSAWR